MKCFPAMLIGILNAVLPANAADLSTASSQDLLAVYGQLRNIEGSRQYASVENVVLKRDAATFTFRGGSITLAEPIAGKVLAAQFEGDGSFELAPVSAIDRRQISRFAGGPKLVDTFNRAVFFFTDDTFEELSKQIKVRTDEKIRETRFASTQKQYAENLNSWIDNQRKQNPPMRNIAARMLADLADKSSKGFFLADFKGDKSGELLFHISWNRDSLLLPLVRMSDEVLLLHLNPGSYYEWWSGFHLSHEYKASSYPDHRDSHVHCPKASIDLEVARNQRISATAQLNFIIAEGSPRVLPFNLNGVLRISSIGDGADGKLAFIQEDRKLDSDPWVILPAPANPKENHKIVIRYAEDSTYESRIVDDRGGRLYFVAARDSWYPSFGRYDGRTQYEINARSPKGLKFVASGLQKSSKNERDALATSWKTEIPVESIGFNYGDFVEESRDLPDIKMTAYAGRGLTHELQGIQTSADGVHFGSSQTATMLRGGINTAANVKKAIAQSMPAFKLFEYLFGKSFFNTLSVIQQPVRATAGGWPNMIIVPYTYFLDSTIKNELGMLETAEQREYERTVGIGEMAHQWLGHLVDGKTYRDQWLWDGGADFATLMYLRHFEPSELESFVNIRRKWLLSKNALGYRPVDAGPLWLNPQLNEYKAENNSLYVTRYKGGYIFEMIRVLMRDTQMENPDGRFISMMRDFILTYAGQNASTRDFQRIVEKHVGRSIQWFFDQWVYGSETPAYSFSYKLLDAEDGQTELSVSITQSGVSDSFRMRLPLYIVIKGQRQYLGLLGVTGTKPFNTSIKLRERPERVLLDPDRSILAEIRQ